jgi:ornithine carbamoyltransferase
MHLLNFKELSGKDLEALVDSAIEVKTNPKKYLKTFEGKSAALIFQKTSTRTRVSFEVAMTQLGGHALYIDWRSTNFALADISDEIQYLSRNVDCIMARLLYDSDVQKMMKASRCRNYRSTTCITQARYSPTDNVKRYGKLKGAKLVYIGVHTT